MLAYYNFTATKVVCIESIVHDDCNDFVISYFSTDGKKSSMRTKSKVRFTKRGTPYFMCRGQRIYLDECIMCK